MAEDLSQLKKPALWLFVSRLLWFWSLLAWGYFAIVTTVNRPTWLPEVSLSSRLWFLAVAAAGAAYLLTFGHSKHRFLGVLANLMLAFTAVRALVNDFPRHPVFSLLVGFPVAVLFLGVPVILLARGFEPAKPVPTS